MKYKIALVEYLNTLPFYEGLRLTEADQHFEIHRVAPSQCARLFKERAVDISLCPVGALDELPEHQIIGNYCIGADGPVNTVMLLSKVPLDEINAVRLDPNSRTSNKLAQILASRLWKKDWKFFAAENGVLPEACVMIGDRVFEEKQYYPYHYDLAEAWTALTGLPMVFAVWIAKPEVPVEVGDEIDQAFIAGMAMVKSGRHDLEKWQVDYLLRDISYPLDEAKREALSLYLDWVKNLESVPSSL